MDGDWDEVGVCSWILGDSEMCSCVLLELLCDCCGMIYDCCMS